jgi:uncharacterized protein YdhG (YjbR/CyaY superfamily)
MHIRSVDDYIASAPEEVQKKLKELRMLIKECAPQAEEKLSYSMPYYGYKGRLAYFAYTKSHIGLYVMPPTIDNFKEELKSYSTAKATIRFPLQEELPIALIKKLIIYGVKSNEAKKKEQSDGKNGKVYHD